MAVSRTQLVGQALDGFELAADAFAPEGEAKAQVGLLALYERAPRELRVLEPRDAGLRRIGHFGWLRPQLREALWSPVRRRAAERGAPGGVRARGRLSPPPRDRGGLGCGRALLSASR